MLKLIYQKKKAIFFFKRFVFKIQCDLRLKAISDSVDL